MFTVGAEAPSATASPTVPAHILSKLTPTSSGSSPTDKPSWKAKQDAAAARRASLHGKGRGSRGSGGSRVNTPVSEDTDTASSLSRNVLSHESPTPAPPGGLLEVALAAAHALDAHAADAWLSLTVGGGSDTIAPGTFSLISPWSPGELLISADEVRAAASQAAIPPAEVVTGPRDVVQVEQYSVSFKRMRGDGVLVLDTVVFDAEQHLSHHHRSLVERRVPV